MAIHQKARQAGIFDPCELALLGRVFKRCKSENGSLAQNEALASRIIASYMAGLTDEAELVATSKQPLGR